MSTKKYEHVMDLPVHTISALAEDPAFTFVDITETAVGRPPGLGDGQRIGVAKTVMTNNGWDTVLSKMYDILSAFKPEEEVTMDNLRELAIAEFGADDSSPNPANAVEQTAYELLWMSSLIAAKNDEADQEANGWFARPEHPKVNVSWFDTIIFFNTCARLLRRDGAPYEPAYYIDISATFDSESNTWSFNIDDADEAKEYRASEDASGKNFLILPMTDLWEFACRAGTKEDHYGHALGLEATDIAWFQENSNSSTQPVGALVPNHFGLYDMLGNVWEWTGQRAS